MVATMTKAMVRLRRRQLRASRQMAATLYAIDKRIGAKMPRALRLRLMRALNRARDVRFI